MVKLKSDSEEEELNVVIGDEDRELIDRLKKITSAEK